MSLSLDHVSPDGSNELDDRQVWCSAVRAPGEAQEATFASLVLGRPQVKDRTLVVSDVAKIPRFAAAAPPLTAEELNFKCSTVRAPRRARGRTSECPMFNVSIFKFQLGWNLTLFAQ